MEKVFYEKGQVKVTDAMYIVGASSYPLNQIAAVCFETKTKPVIIPGEKRPMGCLVSFLFTIVCGILTFGSITSGAGGAALLYLLGFFAFMVWGLVQFNKYPKDFNPEVFNSRLGSELIGYAVVIQTSGGSFSTLESTDKAEAQTVHEALNQALSAR